MPANKKSIAGMARSYIKRSPNNTHTESAHTGQPFMRLNLIGCAANQRVISWENNGAASKMFSREWSYL
jgi:hypothetical protein